jgi:deoxyribonuclease V
VRELHRWDLSPEAAVRVQAKLRERLALAWEGRAVSTVGGVDMSLAGGNAHAAIVVFGFPELKPLEGVTADAPLVFPYIPGLLAFREGPAVLAAWEKLTTRPEIVLFDGQGIAHPRGLGIAAQMGL